MFPTHFQMPNDNLVNLLPTKPLFFLPLPPTAATIHFEIFSKLSTLPAVFLTPPSLHVPGVQFPILNCNHLFQHMVTKVYTTLQVFNNKARFVAKCQQSKIEIHIYLN